MIFLDRQTLLQWLRDEKALFSDDNIIYAEKAFIANSVIAWCTVENKKGNMSKPQIENCMQSLRKYLQGKFELWWEDGTLKIKAHKTHPRKRKNVKEDGTI